MSLSLSPQIKRSSTPLRCRFENNLIASILISKRHKSSKKRANFLQILSLFPKKPQISLTPLSTSKRVNHRVTWFTTFVTQNIALKILPTTLLHSTLVVIFAWPAYNMFPSINLLILFMQRFFCCIFGWTYRLRVVDTLECPRIELTVL